MKNYTAHPHDLVHVPAKFRENTSMRFRVTVRKLNVTDRRTDGRGHCYISRPRPPAPREIIKKTRQLGHPRSPANRFRSKHHNFCFCHIRYVGYIFPLSLSTGTIWGNHLPFNFMLKFPISTIWRNHLPFNQ